MDEWFLSLQVCCWPCLTIFSLYNYCTQPCNLQYHWNAVRCCPFLLLLFSSLFPNMFAFKSGSAPLCHSVYLAYTTTLAVCWLFGSPPSFKYWYESSLFLHVIGWWCGADCCIWLTGENACSYWLVEQSEELVRGGVGTEAAPTAVWQAPRRWLSACPQQRRAAL